MAEYISFQPSDFFNTKLYTGNGSTNAITGVEFQPDFTWIKVLDAAARSHVLTDAVRGVNSQVSSDDSAAATTLTDALTSFDSDGFTLGADTGGGEVNDNTKSFVSWNWKAGTTSGITGGTITPTSYSLSTTSGISILKYTGNNTSGATIAHGLGAVPKFILVKNLDTASTPWRAYHVGLGPDYSITLNETDAKADNSTFWNDTAPTSTLITMGNDSKINGTDDYIMYIFASTKGFSKFGEYAGTGDSTIAPFIYTGFRPGWLMVKQTDSAGQNWFMFDNKRSPFNVIDKYLYADSDAVEATSDRIDFYSNGFKCKDNAAGLNGSGGSTRYIYMAFAEFPLVSSNDIPTVAR